jgi:tripartite-type tricarboxylate transporter receptor subunit TctC
MRLPRRTFLHLAAGAAALPAVVRFASAQTYPMRPVRAVVAFAPGGVTDTFARVMAQKLTEQLGKQVYVENIAGATGNIGTAQVARAPPDGYTILLAFSSHVVNPTLFARVPYDPIKDFDPVTLAVATTVITVHPAVPANTVKELVELIKANPGKYSFGSAGAGMQAHLAGEQFRLSLGLDLVHVPFGGGGPAVAAVVAGHTPISFGSPQAAMQHVREGTVRALAVTSKKRSQIFPDVPTLTEAGYPGGQARSWCGYGAYSDPERSEFNTIVPPICLSEKCLADTFRSSTLSPSKHSFKEAPLRQAVGEVMTVEPPRDDAEGVHPMLVSSGAAQSHFPAHRLPSLAGCAQPDHLSIDRLKPVQPSQRLLHSADGVGGFAFGARRLVRLGSRSRVPASMFPDMIGWLMAIQMAESRDAKSPPSSENHHQS